MDPGGRWVDDARFFERGNDMVEAGGIFLNVSIPMKISAGSWLWMSKFEVEFVKCVQNFAPNRWDWF